LVDSLPIRPDRAVPVLAELHDRTEQSGPYECREPDALAEVGPPLRGTGVAREDDLALLPLGFERLDDERRQRYRSDAGLGLRVRPYRDSGRCLDGDLDDAQPSAFEVDGAPRETGALYPISSPLLRPYRRSRDVLVAVPAVACRRTPHG
jgi:hypothetical protein